MLIVGLLGAAGFWVFEAAVHAWIFHEGGFVESILPHTANEWWMRSFISVSLILFGIYAQVGMTRLRRTEAHRNKLLSELDEALTKALNGFVPMCANCKSIREPDAAWKKLETYLAERTDIVMSHTICPGCIETLYPKAPLEETVGASITS